MELSQRTVGEIEILALQGRFDVVVSPAVWEKIDEFTNKPPAQLVINLQEVDFLDSTGLATLVKGQKQAQNFNGGVNLCGMRQPVRIIFELTRLDIFFDIFTTETEAIAAFNKTF